MSCLRCQSDVEVNEFKASAGTTKRYECLNKTLLAFSRIMPEKIRNRKGLQRHRNELDISCYQTTRLRGAEIAERQITF